MKKNRILSAAIVGISATLLLSGCWGSSQLPTPSSTTTPSPVGTLSAGGNGDGGPTYSTPKPTSTVDPNVDPATTAGLLSLAKAKFPTAVATKKYTKDEVLLALYTADQYLAKSNNDATLISGTWAKSKWNQDVLAGKGYQNFYTIDAYGKLNNEIKTMDDNFEYYKDVFSNFTFLPEGKTNFSVCADKTANCNVAGYPLISDYQVQDSDNGSLLLTVTVETRVKMTEGGKAGYFPVVKEMNLNFVKNDSYKENQGQFPFVIDGWSNNVRTTGFTS